MPTRSEWIAMIAFAMLAAFFVFGVLFGLCGVFEGDCRIAWNGPTKVVRGTQ